MEGAALTEYKHYDLLLLDLMRPGLDGLGIVPQVRRRKDLTPILGVGTEGLWLCPGPRRTETLITCPAACR